MGRGAMLGGVLVPLVFASAPVTRADDPMELLRRWGATAEACDLMRDQP